MKVKYIKHSGFLVETECSYLLFDYWTGDIPAMDAGKTLYVFASHSHPDHYSKSIFSLAESCSEVHYILSDDIADEGAEDGVTADEGVADKVYVGAHEDLRAGNCRVRTLKSTDEGVAFIVDIDGKCIYHAGDLNWWDWPGEPEVENEAYGREYRAEIDRIAGKHFDVAFVVLDPRQEESADLGLEYFIKAVAADVIFPMHMWEDYDAVKRFKAVHRNMDALEGIIEISHRGEEFKF